jgi:hypothetical protein
MGRIRLEFSLLTLFFIVTRCWDIAATYFVTPDLEKETNPIVSIFGEGWTAVIVIQAILVAVIITVNYFSLFKIVTNYPSQRAFSFKEFVAYHYFGEKQNLIKMLYRFPKNKNVLIKALGYILPRALIVISIFISMSSTLLIVNDDYGKFYDVAKPFYYIVMVAIVFLFSVLFFKREYALYQKTFAEE